VAEEEKKERVELGDVIRVLAKHSAVPSDPDDADLLGRFNAQVAEDQAQLPKEEEEEKPSTPAKPSGTAQKGK
jgi:hypothetical protein